MKNLVFFVSGITITMLLIFSSPYFVDMRKVTDVIQTETGVMLYTVDGSGYYWER